VEAWKQEKRISNRDDPLDWWKHNRARFPLLAVHARKFLGCSPTSVPSERLCSGAGSSTVTGERDWTQKELKCCCL